MFNWKEQFYLTVSSAYDSPSGAGWYDSGTTAKPLISSATVSGGTGVQYVFTSWSGDSDGINLSSEGITMNGPKTATANRKTQYYLSISTNFGSASLDSGWYDAGSPLTFSATAPTAESGERYAWGNWTGKGSESYTGSNVQASLFMNGPINETAS